MAIKLKQLFQRAATKQQLLLFLVLWALPLFFINDHMNYTRTMRLLILCGLGGWVLASDQLRSRFLHNLQALNRNTKLALLVMTALMSLSTLLSAEQLGPSVFGFAPEYIGLATWGVFVLIGITLADKFEQYVLSRPAFLLTNSILLIGLVYNKFYIYYGLRVTGLIFQSTTMAMYAAVCLAIGLYGLSRSNRSDKLARVESIACIVLSGVTIIFTQSRVGYVALVFVLFGWAMHRMRRKPLGVLIVALAMVGLSSLPHVFDDYFTRFSATNIDRGTSYRIDLYKISGSDLVKNNALLGNGAGSLPVAINNKDMVPEEIARTLNEDNLFVSTHDMYLDFAHQFGVLASILLVALSVYAYAKNLLNRTNGLTLVIFSVLVLNALLNVPSLELTPLYFVVLFALLVSHPSSRRSKNGG